MQDAKLEKLEKLDEDDFEKLREKRRLDLMKQHARQQEWKSNGHGRYTELTDQVSSLAASLWSGLASQCFTERADFNSFVMILHHMFWYRSRWFNTGGLLCSSEEEHNDGSAFLQAHNCPLRDSQC